MHEPIHVKPFIPLVYSNERPMPFARPDPSDDRFQPNAMLIHAPQRHPRLWMGLLNGFHLCWQVTLKGFLLVGICLLMMRTGNLQGEATSLEIVPAALRMDLAPDLLAHPSGDFGAGPQAAESRSLFKHAL